MSKHRIGTAALAAVALTAAPRAADAFCGFYVAGADSELYNNATQVVLLRDGTRTVLSMQNNYQGPPEDFALVIPVPEVLTEERVKTLDDEVFDRVDKLAAPRLVEYWEQDPCAPHRVKDYRVRRRGGGLKPSASPTGKPDDLGVTIEAQFEVGEYEVVILSAKDSAGLETWLKREKYAIPDGAEPLLRPYVEGGMKFFVAKVNIEKVEMEDGMATLSPLRFDYDDEELRLPVRLGLINAKDEQDLIVHVLAAGKRYQVANLDNVTIPTNLDVKDEVRTRFPEFYAALFDETLAKNPGAVVTEYSWDASSCDPCPTPPLSHSDLYTLGYDVVAKRGKIPSKKPTGAGPPARPRRVRPPPMPRPTGMVLTRLHVRYDAGSLKDDLVFEEAEAIAGGREHLESDGELEEGAQSSSINNFQARYAIRHEWEGPIECEEPRRGIWGGPWDSHKKVQARPAQKLAFAPRGKTSLGSFVKSDIPELGVKAAAADDDAGKKKPPEKDEKAGKGDKKENKDDDGCRASGGSNGAGVALALGIGLALVAVGRRRRRAR